MIQVMNESDVEIDLKTVIDGSFVWNDVIDSQTSWKSNNIFQSPKSSFEQESNVIFVVNFSFNGNVMSWDNSFDNSFNSFDFIIFQTEWSLKISKKLPQALPW